ncbi:MAG: non-canonical purine NTP pyrophosphatase [Phycisphaeraceae bacterium]|nr:non-canonical purine NTP pyrophosphatase [Phycisphaeraceae bacterium]
MNPSPLAIVVATSNPHKVEEIRAIFDDAAGAGRAGGGPDVAIELLSLEDIRLHVPEPVEDGLTFAANAAIKALHYAGASGRWCLADDSGLCVDALDGRPGVQSARFSGLDGPRAEVDRGNNRKLLKLLGRRPADERGAAFVCRMVLACPDPTPRVVAETEGRIEGRILGPGDQGFESWAPDDDFAGRGTNGFGYDPLFLIPELGRTTAELSSEEKNRRSHRGQACRKMVQAIRALPEHG